MTSSRCRKIAYEYFAEDVKAIRETVFAATTSCTYRLTEEVKG